MYISFKLTFSSIKWSFSEQELMTPEKGFDFSKFVKDSDSATRRKLILKRRVSDETEKPVLNLNVPEVYYFNLFYLLALGVVHYCQHFYL